MRPRMSAVTSIVSRAEKSSAGWVREAWRSGALIQSSDWLDAPQSCASGTARSCADPRDFRCERGDLARAGAILVLLGGEPAGLHDIGEDDALADGGREQGRVVIRQRLGGLARQNRAGRAAFSTKRAASCGR